MSIDKIVCIGKNYIEHALELGDAVPEKPVVFLKPASILKQAMNWKEELILSFPAGYSEVQPECEIALQIGCDGYQMTPLEAKKAITRVTLGLDMTLRTHQAKLKKQGHPWTTAKVFVDAAILGPWIPYGNFLNYLDVEFQMSIDGISRQSGLGREMIMSPEDLLVYISHFFPLKAGDIIFTGTPAGVRSVSPGSSAELRWNNDYYRVKWV